MKEKGHDVFYFENIEGGHSGAPKDQRAALHDCTGVHFLDQSAMG
jgi:prolyl oligopeptidase PreP (S9A serine peptidase family)